MRSCRFDLTVETAGPVQIGELLDVNLLPCGQWSIPLSSLNRHAFVCGATGSGKSQTIRTLLEALSTAVKRVPWLVIEPAKAEYAGLAARLPADQDVVVLRPGAPGLIPGGLNPLEPEAGFGPQTHIDLVQALFMAAFEADEPFPQVLSRALLRCYQDRRWNLGTGEPAQSWHMHSPQRPPAWPSLSDLQVAARQVVDDIGYGPEVADNVRGFIDVRIGSLRLGSPGRFFEGGHPLDIGALLEQNVVIELEGLGSDADKAFLIGVVLIRLVEHLRVHRAKATGLMHLTVIEEAHRLLKNVPPGSPAAQAVSLFADLLAEIRAYGEGVAVAEQIPSKIIPDVVKNSAVKVMHRLPATDDRDFIGATMNLDDAGSEYVVTLRPGMAAVHADGMDRPCLVHARHGEEREGGTPAFVPPLAMSRYRECGPICSASSSEACTLRQISRAEELAAALPELTLWVETELIAHLIGGGYQLPALTGITIEQLRDLDPRTAQCAIAATVHRSVDARYGPLAEFYDPSLLGEHLNSALVTTVARSRQEAPGRPVSRECDRLEPEFQAGQRRAPGEYPRLAAPDEPPRLAAGPTDERSGSPATSLPDQAHDAPLDWTNSAPDSASDVIQVVDTPGDLPPVIQAQLRPSDIEAMGFPVEIHDQMMSGGESFEKFAHYGWNDADQTSERQALRVPPDPAHPMTWVREPEEGKEEVFFDGIQNILQTERGQQLTGAEVRQLGRDFVPSDPHESLALACQFDGDHSREEARNARYTLSFEPGAHVTYIKSTVAPQDSPLENRGAELPGGASQILLLNYEAERSSITVSPVGGRVQFDEDGLMRFGYRDRKLPS